MPLTEQEIQKYQELCRKLYGIEISREKAFEDGQSLVLLVQLVNSNYVRKVKNML